MSPRSITRTLRVRSAHRACQRGFTFHNPLLVLMVSHAIDLAPKPTAT